MRHRPACALLLACFIAGCAGVRARSDFDPDARFEAYRTFSWLDAELGTLAGGAGTEGVDPLLERRIREAIESHLEARGFQPVDTVAVADFVVSFTLGSREKIRIQSGPSFGGPTFGYGVWYAGSIVTATSYTEGTLAIDVFDGRSHQAVWHGWASKRIDESANRAAVVDAVVGAILARFPPPR
jgi:hypothetical protein